MSMFDGYTKLRNILFDIIDDASKNKWLKEKNIADIEGIKNELNNGILMAVVFGEFKSGKSTFLNALLGERVLPEAITRYTAIVTKVHYSEQNQVKITWANKSQINDRIKSLLEYIINRLETNEIFFGIVNNFKKLLTKVQYQTETVDKIHEAINGAMTEDTRITVAEQGTDFLDHWDLLLNIIDNYSIHQDNILKENKVEDNIPIKELDSFVAYKHEAHSKCLFISEADIFYSADFLKNGITLVDLPGTGISFDDTQVALDYGKDAHVVLALTPANAALSRSDKEYLLQLRECRNNNLGHLLMYVNRIDTAKQHFQPIEETYTARRLLVENVASELGNAGLRGVDVVAISALSALKAKVAIKQGVDFNNSRIISDFIGIDDERDSHIPKPDKFLYNSRPYPEGISWNEAETKLLNTLVNNRGKILLSEINTKLRSVFNQAVNNIEDIELNLNLGIEVILENKINVNNKIRELHRTKESYNDWQDKQQSEGAKRDSKNIKISIQKKVSKKIESSDLTSNTLYRHIHDHLKTWISISLDAELKNLQHTDEDISFLKKEFNERLKPFKIYLEKIRTSSGLNKPNPQSYEVEGYTPQYIPGRERRTRKVWAPEFFKPSTWFRQKTIILDEGREERYLYDDQQIKLHYRKQLRGYLDLLKPDIETYCSDYYDNLKNNILEEGFNEINKLLKEQREKFEFLEKEISKNQEEKEKTVKALKKEEIKINNYVYRSSELENNINKIN